MQYPPLRDPKMRYSQKHLLPGIGLNEFTLGFSTILF